ncbi:MAG: ADP-ribose polymerase [Bacteroidetes bacterium]|nr:MAG: ADP-ribose polymerase [Bacteroidota bacterium]
MSNEIQPLRTVKLIMVTADNNNKYYDMQENADGTFTVTYGRVGATATKQNYPIREWDKKRREKINKGYADQTHLFAEGGSEIEFADISVPSIQKLMNDLLRYAKKSVSDNYTVSADQVTRKQVEEAQRILNSLVSKIKQGMDTKSFNSVLLSLYQVIPRKMSNVNNYLIKQADNDADIDNINKLVSEEQATLDVMRGQVEMNERKKESQEGEKPEPISILQAMGIEVVEVNDDAVINQIKGLMQDESDKFVRAFAVRNAKTQKPFDEWLASKPNKKLELFWHGSRNENWISILENGLVLRPTNAIISGKMFGYGVYFADKFRKSLNYTSLRGSYWTGGSANQAFLALYDVHVGNQFHIKHHESWCYELNEENLKKKGADYDSLFAEGGADLRNNEFIVYNQAQCTIRYLVEVG